MPSEKPPALAGHLAQADHVDQLVDARPSDPVCLGQRQEMVGGRAAGVDGPGLEQSPDLVQRADVVAVELAVDQGTTAVGRVESQDQPHGCRLSRPVGPEEAGDDSGSDAEAQLIHGDLVAVALGHRLDVDHASQSPTSGPDREVRVV